MITIKDIKYNAFMGDRDYFKAIKLFLSAFKGDIDEILGSHELMYREGTDISALDKKLLDKELGIKYGSRYLFRANFKVDGLLAEFYGEKDTYMMLPKMIKTSKVVTISPETILNYFIKELVKSGYLSDKYYLILAPLLRAFPLGYNPSIGRIGFIEEDIKILTKGSFHLGTNGKRQGQLTSEGRISLEEVLAKEISLGYTNSLIGDPNRGFGYTHSLRKSCGYYMLEWTRKIMLDWNKINVVAASKGSGKSFFAADLCAAELFKEKKGFGGRKIRQIKYFVPDLNNVGSSIMDYMEGFLIEFTRKKINGQPIIKINKTKYEITCTITNTTFRMVSLYNFGSGATGEGLACDFAVIDEAAYIDDAFWTLFSQRAMMETEAMLIITTISEKTPREHWFYRLLVEGELGDELISSHRVDMLQKRELYELNYKSNVDVQTEEDYIIMNKKLDDIMDFTLSDLKQAGIKEYYSRAFCVILDERNVFNIVGSITTDINIAGNENDYYVLAIDFGGNSDPAGVLLLNISKRTTTEIHQLKGVPYLDQLNIGKQLKERLKHLTIVGDATTIGKVIMQEDQRAGHVVDYWVQFTGNGDWSYNNKGFYVSSKRHMVEMTALMLDKGILKISASHGDLINQMKNFVKITGTKSLVAKYQGKGNSHDDLVDALMLCIFYVVTILGLQTSKEWEEYGVEFDNQGETYYNEDNYSESNYTYNTYGNVY